MGKWPWVNHLTLFPWKCEMSAMSLVNTIYGKHDAWLETILAREDRSGLQTPGGKPQLRGFPEGTALEWAYFFLGVSRRHSHGTNTMGRGPAKRGWYLHPPLWSLSLEELEKGFPQELLLVTHLMLFPSTLMCVWCYDGSSDPTRVTGSLNPRPLPLVKQSVWFGPQHTTHRKLGDCKALASVSIIWPPRRGDKDSASRQGQRSVDNEATCGK